jgi:hypothetical protein
VGRKVFDDPNVSIDRDLTHLDRAIAIGFSAVPRLLYVVSIELEDEHENDAKNCEQNTQQGRTKRRENARKHKERRRGRRAGQ